MALALRMMYDFYLTTMTEMSDPRVEEWFLMKSAFPVMALVGLYVYFVQYAGPKLMESRQPFNLDRILVLYNILQIGACIYLVYKFIEITSTYNFWCEPIDVSSEYGLEAAKAVWFYFFVKVCDLMDTIFFVFRKNQRQVTFLHVYHHAGMVLLCWSGCKFFAGGSSIYLGGYNSIVHIFMYTYYLLTVWDKKFKQSIWWKKRLTQLQLAQFALILFQYTQLVIRPSCGFPKLGPLVVIPQNLFMIILFADFYIKTYVKGKQKDVAACSEDVQTAKDD